MTHWKRPWCWEGLGAGGEGDDRGWDGWMASPTWWMWVWVNSGSWWWTGRPSVLWFMGLQRVGHYWATELNWMEVVPHFRVEELQLGALGFSAQNLPWGRGSTLPLPCAVHCAISLMADFLNNISAFFCCLFFQSLIAKFFSFLELLQFLIPK